MKINRRVREELAAIIGALEVVVGIYTALQWDNYGFCLRTCLVTLAFVAYSYLVYKLCFQVYKDIVNKKSGKVGKSHRK